jgi:hypothetical protein
MTTLFLLIAFVSTGPRDTEITVAASYPTRQQCSERAIDLHALTNKSPFRTEKYVCAEWRRP